MGNLIFTGHSQGKHKERKTEGKLPDRFDKIDKEKEYQIQKEVGKE